MSRELLAMSLIILVHVIGACVLVWAMLGDEQPDVGEDHDDRGGGGPPGPPPVGPLPRGGAPLADAVQSRKRLRGPGRIGQWQPRRRRVPSHAPRRTPAPR